MTLVEGELAECLLVAFEARGRGRVDAIELGRQSDFGCARWVNAVAIRASEPGLGVRVGASGVSVRVTAATGGIDRRAGLVIECEQGSRLRGCGEVSCRIAVATPASGRFVVLRPGPVGSTVEVRHELAVASGAGRVSADLAGCQQKQSAHRH